MGSSLHLGGGASLPGSLFPWSGASLHVSVSTRSRWAVYRNILVPASRAFWRQSVRHVGCFSLESPCLMLSERLAYPGISSDVTPFSWLHSTCISNVISNKALKCWWINLHFGWLFIKVFQLILVSVSTTHHTYMIIKKVPNYLPLLLSMKWNLRLQSINVFFWLSVLGQMKII